MSKELDSVGAFALALGQVLGGLMRDDVQAHLLAHGTTESEIHELKALASKIAGAFYVESTPEGTDIMKELKKI